MFLHIFVFYYAHFLLCACRLKDALFAADGTQVTTRYRLITYRESGSTRIPKRGFIANLQSFRTMVPGGLQFSIEKPLFICCMQFAGTSKLKYTHINV